MIEIKRKGFRLDIPISQVVTFKKAQNLNGIQNRYAYSNTVSLEKTANNMKLLELSELPTSKVATMQNGYEVDIVLNGSIQLRNQTMKITKETKDKVDVYILYSDSSLVAGLKTTYINTVTQGFRYTKTFAEFQQKAQQSLPNYALAFVQTQSPAGKYVIEEMPMLINLRHIIRKCFSDLGYTLYGDFAIENSPVGDYFVAPNAGIYQIYGGTGTGFAPSFDVNLTAFELLNQTLAFFNCYADVDDTYKTVIINRWDNLGNYKDTFKDLTGYFVDYQDFAFQSKLARVNELTYSDSEPTFNSFFTDNLSSEEKATYLASKFGSGSTQLFEDSEVQEDGTIPLRANTEPGETSALRIYKIDRSRLFRMDIYEKGVAKDGIAFRAASVSMREVYDTFHKGYADFITSPLIQNIKLRYDAILASEFSLTKVFFIAQQSAYWIPLELNFSTKKDFITVKAMLIKKRKVASPFLKNFNSILLDFKQASYFTKTMLLSMYPLRQYLPVPPLFGDVTAGVGSLPPRPANQYPMSEVIFTGYDGSYNRLYVNGVFLPADSLPQTFLLSELTENSIVIEADPTADQPNTVSESLYLRAVDTNGGVSNEAYINIKHTGIARLESNFQSEAYLYEKNFFNNGRLQLQPFTYFVGQRPNLSDTFIEVAVQALENTTVIPESFNLVQSDDAYTDVRVRISPFTVKITDTATGSGTDGIRTQVKLIVMVGATASVLATIDKVGTGVLTANISQKSKLINSLPYGTAIKVYLSCDFITSNSGVSRSVKVEVSAAQVAISTVKTIV